MKNILLLPRYTGQCNISVFKLFTPIRPKIKHQATCLDLSQKSSSSNTPTSDYYLKHYHQPKCNQPGHKFVDEDQEKTSEQSTKLKLFGPYTSKTQTVWTSSSFWFFFGPPVFWFPDRKFGLFCRKLQHPTLLYHTIIQVIQLPLYKLYSYTAAPYLSSNLPVCC